MSVGAAATLLVQRSAARETRARIAEERRAAHRAEVKAAISSYLEAAHKLQGELDARERGEAAPAIKGLVERLWPAEKQVEIISSDDLQQPLIAHNKALHDVSREPTQYPDWWVHLEPLQTDLLRAVKRELRQLCTPTPTPSRGIPRFTELRTQHA
ncbi:hypothetical protein [Streptomyces sp. NPDC051561]|uniref:hypothetical protein n=1 Tax=Streptomyces sp. NPDC051561 TaxID=3365658 RepID=UPI0037BC22C7